MSRKHRKQRAEKSTEQPDLLIRAAQVTVETREEGDAKIIRMSVSSEAPVLSTVNFQDRWMRAYEVLDHSEKAVDLSRCKDGLVILDRHYGDQIGLMSVELRDGKMGGEVRFCSGERARDIAADAAQGLRRNVSVGYMVDSDSYVLEGDKDGVPVVRATRWTPYEASFEPVPADPSVGVNRAADEVKTKTAKVVAERKIDMDPKEMSKLFARASKHGIEVAKVEALIEDGKGRAELDALIVEKQEADGDALRKENETLKARKPAVAAPEAPVAIGAPAVVTSEARSYSMLNVCRAFAGSKVDIGFEREVSEECAKMRGKAAEGMIIPYTVLAGRDFTVSGTSSSSVATDLQSDQFIDVLRTNYSLGRLGVQFLPGLVGDIAIPKMTAGTTGYWVSEGSDITESQPTLGQVTGSPHTCGALVDISRKLIAQSTPAAEQMVRSEIIERVMRTVQIAVFAGTGSDGEPSAITTASGINNPSVTTGTPTYAEIIGFIGSIMADNAMADGQKWAMTGEVWAKLAATATNGTGSPLLIDPSNPMMMIGRGIEVTEDLPANSLWLGNWRSVVVGIWGNGVDVAVTDSKLFASGGITLRALQDVDVMVRLGQALAYNATVTS